MWVQVPVEAKRRYQIPGAGVRGSCELLVVGAGTILIN